MVVGGTGLYEKAGAPRPAFASSLGARAWVGRRRADYSSVPLSHAPRYAEPTQHNLTEGMCRSLHFKPGHCDGGGLSSPEGVGAFMRGSLGAELGRTRLRLGPLLRVRVVPITLVISGVDHVQHLELCLTPGYP